MKALKMEMLLFFKFMKSPFFPQETIRDVNPLKHVFEIGHWLVAL
jgi:hypothetical protein